MELTGADLDRIPATNLRVPVLEFARVWVTAERRADALAVEGKLDGYLTGVLVTCRWLSDWSASADSPTSRIGQVAWAPITGRKESAYEELIADETVAAESWIGREWPGTPGFSDAVAATLQWAWRRSGRPPIEASSRLAG
jgi:hypothetical protein